MTTWLELTPRKHLHLYAGRTHPELAAEIAGCLGVQLGDANIVDFANGEMRCRIGETVRGADVFIMQSHAGTGEASINDALWEQLIMIDAAKRASAKRITAVCPYYPYSRQDRKSAGREPITAKLVADMLHVAGADRIMSVDLHSGQIQGFFDGPFDHLVAMPLLVDHLRDTLHGEVVVVAPDAGRVKVAERYAAHLSSDMASVYKRRSARGVNQVEALDVMGEVEGRLCVIVDDMIDTAGTMCAAAELLMEKGAVDVWAVATHGLLSGPAVDRIKNSPISRLIITNTVPLPPEKQVDKIECLSIAGIIADAIGAVFEDTSVSEIFGGENLT